MASPQVAYPCPAAVSVASTWVDVIISYANFRNIRLPPRLVILSRTHPEPCVKVAQAVPPRVSDWKPLSQVDLMQLVDPEAELLRHACAQVIAFHPGFVQVVALSVGQTVVLVVS